MQGVDPMGTQPQVALNGLSSIASVVHTEPAEHAPPHVGPERVFPPESSHGVDTSGRHVQACVGPAAVVAQQLEPAGHEPPQPGQTLPPQGGPDDGMVVVVVGGAGFRATNTAAACAASCARSAASSPFVLHAPAAFASAFAQLAANFVSHLASCDSPPRRMRAASFSTQSWNSPARRSFVAVQTATGSAACVWGTKISSARSVEAIERRGSVCMWPLRWDPLLPASRRRKTARRCVWPFDRPPCCMPARRTDQLDRLDRAHLVHGFGSPAVAESEGTLRLVRGRGVYVWDSQGRRYIDGLSSLWNVAVGHGRREIARAVAKQMREIEFAPTLLGFSTEPAIRLAARIARMAPKGLRPCDVHLGRVRVERERDPSRAAVLAAPRPAGQDRYRRAAERLPRHVERRGEPHRAGRVPPLLRTAAAGGVAHPTAVLLPLRAGEDPSGLRPRVRGRAREPDPPRGRRPHRRAHRRARAGSRRCDRAATRVLRAPARHLRPSRRPARGRRGHHGLRPARQAVRHPAFAGDARPAGVRQGGHQRLPTARRSDPARPCVPHVGGGGARVRAPPRLHVFRPPGRLRRRAREPGHHRTRGAHCRRAAQGAVLRAPAPQPRVAAERGRGAGRRTHGRGRAGARQGGARAVPGGDEGGAACARRGAAPWRHPACRAGSDRRLSPAGGHAGADRRHRAGPGRGDRRGDRPGDRTSWCRLRLRPCRPPHRERPEEDDRARGRSPDAVPWGHELPLPPTTCNGAPWRTSS